MNDDKQKQQLTELELDGVAGGSPMVVVTVVKAILGTITNIVGYAADKGVFSAAPHPLNNPK